MTIPFFPKTININGVEYDTDLEDALSIRETNLNYEFCRQAELFAFYSTAYELALFELGRKKVHLEQLCAQLDYKTRMEAKNGAIKMTETMVEHTIKGSKDYLISQEEMLEVTKLTGLLKQAKDAIVQKKSMLEQLGFTQRQERNSDPSMKADYLKHTTRNNED
jgi:hypothetical protein